ncbi:MAG: cytochrome ubiquinol oxidase subunit I [Candidatus Dormiibacterota bacterium]
MELAALDLARWQFGSTTIYHFLFVPLSIGLAPLVALLETAHYRTGDAGYRRLAAFFSTLFLINFAMGVATGLVQEFQFGMNWSEYSRYVGDVFGVPLALEGLLAFFMESTFLGLYMFGRGRLPRAVHLTTIWLVAIGSVLSALMILAANSWMQHPVGYQINPTTHHAEMTDVWAVLFNPTLLLAFPHTVLASFLTGGLFMLGVSAFQLLRGRDSELFRKSARLAVVWCLISSFLVVLVGDSLGQLVGAEQPMKTAAAEALYQTQAPAEFSLFAIGTPNGGHLVVNVTVPYVLSVLVTRSFSGKVQGINNLQAAYQTQFGPGNYIPFVPVTYWGFRIMVGIGFLALGFSLVGLYLFRRGRIDTWKWFQRAAIVMVPLPFVANSAGWLFTEMGRQPWVVFGLLKTQDAVTPSAGIWSVALSLGGFVLLYLILAVIEGWLMWRTILGGAPSEAKLDDDSHLELAY